MIIRRGVEEVATVVEVRIQELMTNDDSVPKTKTSNLRDKYLERFLLASTCIRVNANVISVDM